MKLTSKYIVSGIAAFCAEYSLFWLLYTLSHMLLFANTLSFLGGLAVSFSAQRQWTFRMTGHEYHHGLKSQASLFLMLSIINLLISNVAIEFLKATGLHALVCKVCVMVVVAMWNYLAFKYGIFRKRVD